MSEVEGVIPSEKAQFEMLCLANYVEVQNGLLYMAGGGWTDHHRSVLAPNGQKTTSRISIAILVKIPWGETNRKQKFLVAITDLDGGVQLLKVEGELNTGRPPMLTPGSAQYAALAVNMDIIFPQAGTYLLSGVLNEDAASKRTWEFRVHDLNAAR
jgi:hypothetical protein